MLKYVGNGALPGIPARDLSDDEIKKFVTEKKLRGLGFSDGEISKIKDKKAFLVSTGLYEAGKSKVVKDGE